MDVYLTRPPLSRLKQQRTRIPLTDGELDRLRNADTAPAGEARAPRRVPVKAGDVILWRSDLVHAAAPPPLPPAPADATAAAATITTTITASAANGNGGGGGGGGGYGGGGGGSTRFRAVVATGKCVTIDRSEQVSE